MKKILAMLLAVCMVFSMVPVLAMAEEAALEPLTGVGIEFNAEKAVVAEDWTVAGSASVINANSIYLADGNSNTYIGATHNSAFNLTNGFTVAYKVDGRYYNNYAKGNTYNGVVIGNVTVGPEVLDDAKSAVVLKIRINDTVVATSENIFDSTKTGWNAEKANAENVGNFLGGFGLKEATLDYDTKTKTLTYSHGDYSVSYVDEDNIIDVSNAAVVLRTHTSWAGYANFTQFKLEGKKPSLSGTTITFSDVELTSLTADDWTKTSGSFKTADYGTYVKGSNSTDAQVTTKNAYDLSKDFVLNVGYGKINYNTKSGYNFTIKIGGVDIKIEPNTFAANFGGAAKATVSVDGTVVGEAKGGNYASSSAFKTAVGSDVTADRFITALVTYKDGVLKVTISGVVVFEGEITTDLSNAKVALIEQKKTGWSNSYIYDFSLKAGSTTLTLQDVEDLMASLADASLETYADAAATIDAIMPLLSADKLELLTSFAVYEKYKADYTAYNADKVADAEIIAKNASYKLINGLYAEDWKDVTGGGSFYRGDTVFGSVTATGDGFYADGRAQFSMTSKYPLATANNYFKIVQQSKQSEYNDTNFKWTIGDLTIGIYVDGNNPSNSYGDTGYNDGKKMAIFQIFYKGNLVKVITGEANNYGFDTSVDPCSTWMLTNCEFTTTYDNGNLMITFYNGATKYVTPKTGLDLNTLIEGFNYNPNGKHVKLDIFTSYSQLRFNKLVITGKANKAAVDNLAALAQTNPGAAKLIYDSISDKSIVDDATAAILNGEFAVSAENATYDVTIGNYNSKTYRYGDTVTFTAASNGAFIGWYDGEGKLLTTDAAYTCVIEPGKTIVAKAEEGCAHANTVEVTENAVDADCVNGGSYDKVVKCDNCGEEISRETVTTEALGHDYDTVVTAPTCTTGGYTTYTCAVCGDSYVADQVSALGHTVVKDEAVAPTLNTTGLTEGAHCGTCGEVLVAQEEVPMIVGEASIVGGLNYATLEEAVAAAVDGDVIVLNLDVTTEAILTIDKAITINGYGHTLTYVGKGASARAINVDCAGDVAIIDLVVAAADAERAINVINKAGNITLTKVTAVASHYPVNVAGSAAGATVTINDSDLTGLNVVNIRANNVTVEINDSKLTVIDNADTETYSAIFVGKEVVDGTVAMNGGEVVLGGDSNAASYWSNVDVTFTDVIGVDKVVTVVATIGDAGYTTLADAITDAKDGETITLLRDITLTEFVKIAKKVTIDLNGNDITADFTSAYGAIYVAPAGDLTIKGAGTITSADIAIGNYGKLAIDGATVNGDYASIYNFYFDANTYGKATINGTVEGWVLNCGEMTIDGSVAWVDNSGALAVNGDVEYIYARDGGDAAGVEGAGTIAVADPSAIEVPEDYKLVETADGVYAVVAKEYVAQVGDVKYETLAEAIAAANGEDVKLVSDIALAEPVVVDGVVIDFNGHTVSGTLIATFKLNGGDLITAEGYKMIGANADYYSTEDAVVSILLNGDIVIESGVVTLAQNWWTTDGQTLTIAKDATFIIPAGIKLNINGSTVVVAGTAIVDGEANLFSKDATVEAAEDLNVTTTAGDAVLYVDGKYIVHDHSYKTVVTDPTCTAEGYTTYTCDCGDSYVADKVPATGHNYDADVTAPTCTEDGYTTYTCAVCGDSYVADEVAATGHNYDADVTAPTCGAEGYTTYTCACGDTYVGDVVPATGEHAWGEFVPNEDGVTETKTCGTCGATETQDIEVQIGGTTGEVTWRFDNGTLYIEGNGKMANYVNVGDVAPWQTVRKETTAIVIGDGVTYIGNRAFKGFNRVTTVSIGKDVTTMGYECFYACNKITTINLPEGLTHLGALTFYNCTGLTQIDIPASVTNIENRAFKGSGLTSVVVPDTVTKMGYEVFMNCASLAEVDFTEGVSMLQPRTFENCTSLTTFNYTRNMCRIRTRAFYGCTALESVVFEDADNMWASSNGNDAKIASDAFEGCNATLKLIADEGTHVEQYAAKRGFVFEAK